MANVVQLKRSSVVGKKPTDGDLEVGELAVNLADGILYSKNTAGNVIVVGSSTTSNVEEGVNLYFTNTRAVYAFTAGNDIHIDANGLISSTATVSGGSSDFNSFTTTISGSETELYSFNGTNFRGGRFTITYNDSPNFKIEDVLIIHDGTNAVINEPYTTDNQASIGTIDITYKANVVGTDVKLYATAASGTPTVKGEVNLIAI